jgi:hypothetical protein
MEARDDEARCMPKPYEENRYSVGFDKRWRVTVLTRMRETMVERMRLGANLSDHGQAN